MTKISWTEKTWNPVVGCSIASPGCTNCYAMGFANRLLDKPGSHYEGTTKKVNGNAVWTGKIAMAPENKLMEPLKRKKPTTYFVNSMGDLFHENISDAQIDEIFAIMATCPQHTFQVLTKRASRMREYVNNFEGRRENFDCNSGLDWCEWPLKNCWLGVSAENQEQANIRIPFLLDTPAAVRFVSIEPQLEDIYLSDIPAGNLPWNPPGPPTCSYLNALTGEVMTSQLGRKSYQNFNKLDWVIQGCESGPNRRPFNIEWANYMRYQCAATNAAYFLKQIQDKTGKVVTDPLLDGVRYDALPLIGGA